MRRMPFNKVFCFISIILFLPLILNAVASPQDIPSKPITNNTSSLVCNEYSNGCGSAIGSFFGVIIFFAFRFLIELWIKRKRKIIEYPIANNNNIGQEKEQWGHIMHHHGKRISDKNEFQKYGFNNPVWEWSRDAVGDKGTSLFYGPYTTDLNEPGKYEVEFIIKGIGFSKPEEIINDYILIEIDVAESKMRTEVNTVQGLNTINPIVMFQELNIIGKKYITISDLAKNNKSYKITVTSTGKGLWEYRAFAFDGTNSYPDNLANLGNNIRILFDKIVIWKIRDIKLPWD